MNFLIILKRVIYMKKFALLLICFSFAISFKINAQTSSQNESSQFEEGLEILFLQDIPTALGTRSEKRTPYNSMVPIDVISASEIEKCGFTTTIEAMSSLIPAFNYVHGHIIDGSDHVKIGTLRGLQPDQVLVLINGKRRHYSAMFHVNQTIGSGSTGIDYNMIPINAIERIEILRDGAAAQYGSDAIAGIINIVLKNSAKNTLTYQYAQTHESDGKTNTIMANLGLENKDKHFNVALLLRDSDNFNRAGPDPRQQYLDGDPRNNDPSKNNLTKFRFGEPKFKDYNMMFNFSSPLKIIGNDDAIYSFGGVGFRHGESGGYYRRSLDDRNVRAIYPDGFLPLIAPDIYDYSFTVGVKREVSKDEWNYDISQSIDLNTFKYIIDDSVNVSYGASSPTKFDAGKLSLLTSDLSLDVSKNFYIGLSNPLSFGAGAEYRYEQYKIFAGEEASYADGGIDILDGPNAGNQPTIGSQVFPGFSTSDATNKSRDSFAIFADIENKIIDELMLGLAVRHENFSDFGKTTNGKFSARYELTKGLAFRSSASTGFRSPSLPQQYYKRMITNIVGGNLIQNGLIPVDDPLARELGATSLKAEKSKHASVGFIFEPVDNFTISLDYFIVNIKDRILVSQPITGDLSAEVAEILNRYSVSGCKFFFNAIDTKTEGCDFVMKYTFDIDANEILNFYAGINFNKTKLDGEIKSPNILSGNSEILFGPIELERLEYGQPRDKIILKSNYVLNKFDTTLQLTRFGSIKTSGDNFRAKWLTDIQCEYNFLENFSVAAGANNIFNILPDRYSPDNSYYDIMPYTDFQPFAISGAYYYLKAKYQF